MPTDPVAPAISVPAAPQSAGEPPDAALVRQEFRQAMRFVAATVNIVTALDEAGGRAGMVATAICSVSMDPPSLLVCINRSASMHALVVENFRFCVNILSSEQEGVAKAFVAAREHVERFSAGNWTEGWRGLPYLVDSRASLFCEAQTLVQFGSHIIVIAEVRDVIAPTPGHPLLYLDGRFTKPEG